MQQSLGNEDSHPAIAEAVFIHNDGRLLINADDQLSFSNVHANKAYLHNSTSNKENISVGVFCST